MKKFLCQSTVMILAFILLLSGVMISAGDQSETNLLKTTLAADYLMMVGNTSAWAGDHGHIFCINGTWTLAIKTYSMKLYYDKTKIEIANVTLNGCVGEHPFSFIWKNNRTNGFITATVMKTENIPSGKGTLFNVVINISDGALSGKTTLNLVDGIDTYYKDTNGVIRNPVTIDGNVDILTGNRPPQQPTITGPIVGGSEIQLNISAVTTDPDGDQVYYNFSWGDGNYSDWLGPFNSTTVITSNYTWIEDGSYQIRVKAKDTNEAESDWSKSHNITIARQIEYKNIQPGFIYFQLFTFNRSYFYIHLLDLLGATVFITTNDLLVEAKATDAVKKVHFEALSPLGGDIMTRDDDVGSNGFSCQLNLSLGLYQITITAFDNDGNLIDIQTVNYCLFLRLGSGGGSGGQGGQLRHHIKTLL